MKPLVVSTFILLMTAVTTLAQSDESITWSALPDTNDSVSLPAQEWQYKKGPRTVKVYVYYPQKALANITENTGLMLSLHNWGGTNAIGTANPQVLADKYNVIAICVDYLQSGKFDVQKSPPYDFGYLQALDALRALYWVHNQLHVTNTPFNDGRIYSTGGSGGGNVTQMVNKFAPRTFACIIDMCGMAKLNDDIAFGLEGGSYLNAGYSRDPKHPYYLSPDAQEMRNVGNPAHLKQMKDWGHQTKIFIVHGSTDDICLVDDKREVIRAMKATGFDVMPLILEDKHLDGKIYNDTGHSLGNRTLIVQDVADAQLLPDSPNRAVRKGPSDFNRKEALLFKTTNGHWEISYKQGYPVGAFKGKTRSHIKPSQTKVLVLAE